MIKTGLNARETNLGGIKFDVHMTRATTLPARMGGFGNAQTWLVQTTKVSLNFKLVYLASY